MRPFLAAVLPLLFLQVPLVAQHDHEASPYAHTQTSEIPTLNDDEIAQLRNGEGMGLARAADLNRYPGPKHVLELDDQLGLDEAQRALVAAIRLQMSGKAIAKGEEILRAEQHLSELFKSGAAIQAAVARITDHLGAMRGELQSIHLNAHIKTVDILTAELVTHYVELRGYGDAAPRASGDSSTTSGSP